MPTAVQPASSRATLRKVCQTLSPLAILVFTVSLASCGGGGTSEPPPPPAVVTISGASDILSTGASRTFTASIANSSDQSVTWSIVEASGGSITTGGVYTAPSLPGTFHVKAVAKTNASASATDPIPVVIPVGHIPGYDVGVD